MDGAGDQLLAHARLAQDVDRGLAAGDLGDGLAQLGHGRRVAEQAHGVLGRGGRRRGTLAVVELQRVADQAAQHVDVHRLADEVEGAGLERLHRQFDIAEGGDHGHRRTGEIARDLLDQLDAIAVGQAHVGEAQVVGVAGQQLAGFADIGGGVDPKAHATQGQGQQLSDVAFVIDDQGATGVAHHGLALRATQSTCWMCPRGRFAAAVGRVLTRRP